MTYESFSKKSVNFELRGERGDWGLFVDTYENSEAVMTKIGGGGWDGYVNHFATKADAKKAATQIARKA